MGRGGIGDGFDAHGSVREERKKMQEGVQVVVDREAVGSTTDSCVVVMEEDRDHPGGRRMED